jgi:hypothetical protein
MSTTCKTEYLTAALDRNQANIVIKAMVKLIKASQIEFDAIAFRGMSGALIAPIIAYKMNKPIIMVRKKGGSHSSSTIEGYKNAKTYIVIDDFVCGGDTIKTIINTIFDGDSNGDFKGAIPVGIFLYRSSCDTQIRFYTLGFVEHSVKCFSFHAVDESREVKIYGSPIPTRVYVRKSQETAVPVGDVVIAESYPGVTVAA